MEIPGSASDLNQEHSPQVCSSCKARKRKCNKALPKCSSCLRRNLECDYSKPQSTSNRKEALAGVWYNSHYGDNQADSHSVDFPTMLFLDPNLLQHGQVDLSQDATPISAQAHILQQLGDFDSIRVTASKFFEHIHMWLPIISKKRFYDIYLRPSFQSRSDVVLLLLSLKLITTLPPKDPRNSRTPLYYAAKHFYLEVEGSGMLSIPVLQAAIIITLYELGHAIYPAAFLSVGVCAQYASALGISGGRIANIRRAVTLVEVEERRRVWWAIVILERFLSIGCPGRPFVTADPSLDDYLPVDDAAWDQGIVRSEDTITLSSPKASHMSKFALLCQAARVLGEVIRHVSSDSANDNDCWIQLDRTLQSMITASQDVDPPDHDQIAFIYSALMALHTPWLQSNALGTERQERARAVVKQISEAISVNNVRDQCLLGRTTEEMPLWGLFFAYRICVAHGSPRNLSSDSYKLVKFLKEAFLAIDVRWNAAGVYLQLLEAQEIMNDY